MNVKPLQDLASGWRTEAALFRRRGMEQSAQLAESYAAELEARIQEWGLEALTLEAAALETGLAHDTLQKKISRGTLPNAGAKRSPRVRRRDLYGPPGLRLLDESSLADEILTRRAAS
jgi:hypothetical protein